MYLIRRWNEIMGPKDERLEAEDGRIARISAYILLAGSVISLYYGILLDQVASTTEHPILTPLGQSIVPVQLPLALTILAAGITSIALQTRSGYFSTRKRFAEIDRIPWNYALAFAAFCGAVLGILTCVMRILAEVQIVGLDHVAWLGDIAIGIVFFGMGFALGLLFITASIHDAIKQRRRIEQELED